jgi:hypothetical protein
MAEQMRPSSKKDAPDPSHAYERSHPSREAGMGRLDNNKSTPANASGDARHTVTNAQDGARQLNAHDDGSRDALAEQPDHSMKDEEPLGWDQAPMDEQDPRKRRHPRQEGKGGTS